MTVATVTDDATFTTIVKVAVSAFVTVPFANTILPFAPGVTESVRDQPALPVVAETSVVPAGSASVTVTVCASLGPLFWKLTV